MLDLLLSMPLNFLLLVSITIGKNPTNIYLLKVNNAIEAFEKSMKYVQSYQ